MLNAETFQVTLPSDRSIHMTRVFNAPRELVFAAITQPAYLRQWLNGPPGWTLPVCELDLRVGGPYRFEWHGPEGAIMGVQGTLREVNPPVSFSATERFDRSWYPGEGFVTYHLDESDGKTTLTLKLLYESKEARDIVLKSPMDKGVAKNFDALEQLFAAQSAAR
jgi:uncharacterized protein YndB with AHSA1/START domain